MWSEPPGDPEDPMSGGASPMETDTHRVPRVSRIEVLAVGVSTGLEALPKEITARRDPARDNL